MVLRGLALPSAVLLYTVMELFKFEIINSYLDKLYIQIQKIMTQNKLLFTGNNDEFMEDQDLKERIKRDNLLA